MKNQWFVLHTLAGQEQRVKDSLEKRLKSEEMGEYILPYGKVRRAADPDADLLAFLESTYAAAAETGNWDRVALERR